MISLHIFMILPYQDKGTGKFYARNSVPNPLLVCFSIQLNFISDDNGEVLYLPIRSIEN